MTGDVSIPNAMVNSWISLGIGGVLALVIFQFYRKDIRQYTELWKSQTEVLMKIVIDNTEAMTANTNAIRNLADKMGFNHIEENVNHNHNEGNGKPNGNGGA